MKMNAIKKLGRASLLAAIFAASAMPALAQTGGRGPNGDKQYASLKHEIDGLADISAEIGRTVRTAQINNEKVDQDAIKALRSSLKEGMDAAAPKIILASDLSAQDVQMLLDQFKQRAGPLPDYLAKVNGKAKLVRVCQEYLVTPDGAVDREHAVEVANCVASKQVVNPAPPPGVTAEPTHQQQVTPQAVLPQPAAHTTPVDTTPVNTAPVNNDNAGSNASSSHTLEIAGGAAGVVVLGTGAVLLMRRRKKPDPAPAQEPAAAEPPPSPPPPEQPPAPPKAETKIDIPQKPLQVTPPVSEPHSDDTAPAKKPRKFEI